MPPVWGHPRQPFPLVLVVGVEGEGRVYRAVREEDRDYLVAHTRSGSGQLHGGLLHRYKDLVCGVAGASGGATRSGARRYSSVHVLPTV